jgi:pilus assembly protein Flp/PilA
MLDRVRHLYREHGQGLVEYALILVFVAVVLIALLVILGPGISNIYSNIVKTL